MNKLIAAFIIMMLGLVAPAHVLASGGEDSGKIDPYKIYGISSYSSVYHMQECERIHLHIEACHAIVQIGYRRAV